MNKIQDLKSLLDNLKANITKQIKYLKQDLSKNNKPDIAQKGELLIKIINGDDEQALLDTPFQRQKDKMKESVEKAKEYQNIIKKIKEEISDPEMQKIALDIANAFKDAEPAAEKLSANTKELSAMFSSAINDMISGTKDFGDVVKSLLAQMQSYFIKSAADAVVNGVINSTTGQQISSAIAGIGNFSSGIIGSGFGAVFDVITSIFKHHSGGVIASGTGNVDFSMPGTAEYLAILKGGERVLSPAESVAYNKNSSDSQVSKKNMVVNNFNIQAWDSKDVKEYLLDNKNLLASITAENIRCNNGNLRYAIGMR